MDTCYTSEKNVQILIALMKEHGIKKVIASPGTTNITFVASMQSDPYFEIYSAADERSAAYIACGLAEESGEPVALSCTGATASRNYVPGLTEAFYRKLPVLAVTSTQHTGRIGQLAPQVIDRSQLMNDIAKISIQVPEVHSTEDEWFCGVQINRALLELHHHGGGPVHINLTTTYSRNFTIKELPKVKVIRRIGYSDKIPKLERGRIAVYVGAHHVWNDELTHAVDNFCESYNGVVICEHISNYRGKYGVHPSLLTCQQQYICGCAEPDIMIHIGNVSGFPANIRPKQVWRVNPDGEIRDTFKKLTCVFEMEEFDFFQRYIEAEEAKKQTSLTYYEAFKAECGCIASKIPDLPFSNAWIAQQTGKRIPSGSILHLGILNTVRVWELFPISENVSVYANTGGFGIDGMVSALLGAALANPKKIHFGIIGDLGFFYDMNSIGNRHISNNFRLMVINNGRGTEFRNFNHPAARFGEEADAYMAAAGHYGNKSPKLIKHYAEDLGFEYMCASNKQEYMDGLERFVIPELTECPMLFEVFTDSKLESDVLEILYGLEVSVKGAAKQAVKNVLGEKGVQTIKKLMGK